MDLRQERTIELDASPAQVWERLRAWAQASGFVSTEQAPRRWAFTRGGGIESLLSFDIRRVPTEVVVEIVADAPLAVRFRMHVRSAMHLETGGDAGRVAEQMDLLTAHLRGAL